MGAAGIVRGRFVDFCFRGGERLALLRGAEAGPHAGAVLPTLKEEHMTFRSTTAGHDRP
jgi:hypothetical protein